MQAHYIPTDLPGHPNSRCRWAINPDGTLIIFVHGFGGSAVATWLQFPSLLPLQKQFSRSDLIFYEYDGRRTRATPSAARLYALLTSLCINGDASVNQSLPNLAPKRRSPFSFKRIILVAHSLGAIISRLALLFAHQQNSKWAQKVNLVLFAPAHKGSDIVQTCSSLLGIVKVLSAGAVDAALKSAFPVLKDLDENSSTLVDLEKQTLAALHARGGNHFLIAKAVIIGDQDRVVNPNQFAEDPPPTLLLGRNHRNICKPDVSYVDPIRIVAQLV